jgi:hypothetical protein
LVATAATRPSAYEAPPPSAAPVAVEAAAQARSSAQRIDEEYTRRIREASTEKRVMTELVDHLPASDTIPTPLKFLGYFFTFPRPLAEEIG